MKQRHILLVDDEESVRLTLSHQIKKAGYTVTLAESGEQAMEILHSTNGNIDIVLTDLVMDDMDGIQVLKNAKQLRPEVQVMLLTGYGSMETVMDALRFGAHDFLVKPCSQEELLLKLKKCAERVELEETLHKTMDDLAASNQKLERLSSIDGLTEIANRRCFDEYLEREWSLATRNKLPIALIFIDVDYFKLFNDTYGHQAGDDCLRQVAQTISESLNRPADMVARYGGEEFIVILPGTEKAGAVRLAENIRQRVENLEIPHGSSSVHKHVTISLGVGVMVPDKNSFPLELINIADKALYNAKHKGRNRVE